jgi:hypothetical protein
MENDGRPGAQGVAGTGNRLTHSTPSNLYPSNEQSNDGPLIKLPVCMMKSLMCLIVVLGHLVGVGLTLLTIYRAFQHNRLE